MSPISAARPAILPATLDGITPLPPGYVATIKTYLECTAARAGDYPLPPGYRLERLTGQEQARYRRIFRTLGQRWLWWSRLLLDETALSKILDDDAVQAFAVTGTNGDCGLLEWDMRDTDAPELAFLGLYDSAIGNGLGNALMALTQKTLLSQPARKFRVNTCTFDHPGALGFYRRWGFQVTGQAIEIVADPRLSGVLAFDSAAHVPVTGSVNTGRAGV